MKSVTHVAEAREFCQKAPRPLVFVPTMGALHKAHAELVRHARVLAGPSGTVVASVFVILSV